MLIINVLITFLIGLLGGTFFFILNLPLPWILGSAFAIMFLNSFKPERLNWPRWISDAGIMTIAFILGQMMTIELAKNMYHDFPWMITSAIAWLLVCFIMGYILAKITKVSLQTGILGSVPGGLSQMVLISYHIKGADPGTVAIIQTARLVFVLYTVPFLAALFAQPIDNFINQEVMHHQSFHVTSLNEEPLFHIIGYIALPLIYASGWLAKRLNIAAGEFLAPFILVGFLSILHIPFLTVPNLIAAGAQITIGIFIGSRVQPKLIFINKRLGPAAILSSAILVCITAVAAWFLSNFTADSIVTWFLALAPGGLNEVAITALVLDANVTTVTAYQVIRIIFILLIATPVIKFILNKIN